MKELNNFADVVIDFKFYDIKHNRIIDFFDDMVEIDGEANVEIQKSKYFDENGKLTITKGDAKIQIVNVNIPINTDGTPLVKEKLGQEIVGIAKGAIIIRKPIQAAAAPQAQTRTLTLGLFHLKDTADSFEGVVDNCNFNVPCSFSPVQES